VVKQGSCAPVLWPTYFYFAGVSIKRLLVNIQHRKIEPAIIDDLRIEGGGGDFKICHIISSEFYEFSI